LYFPRPIDNQIMKNGLVHIYTGEGKGKTTAAIFQRKNTDGEFYS